MRGYLLVCTIDTRPWPSGLTTLALKLAARLGKLRRLCKEQHKLCEDCAILFRRFRLLLAAQLGCDAATQESHGDVLAGAKITLMPGTFLGARPDCDYHFRDTGSCVLSNTTLVSASVAASKLN